ncbi:MAG: hypothetical protein Q8Q28_13025 [Pseudomonadota bacterium]|nr:hypothetical protein [Pseudomonadota bacterium]
MSVEHSQRRHAGPTTRLSAWQALILVALLLGLVPLDPNSPLFAPALSRHAAGLLLGVPEQFYLFIKAVILWVPVGMLAGLLEWRAVWLQRLALLVLAGMAFIALPLLPAPRIRDVLEILVLLPGLTTGYWLGGRIRRSGAANSASRPQPAEDAISVAPPPLAPAAEAAPVAAAPASERQPAKRRESHRSHRSGTRAEHAHHHSSWSAGLLGVALLALVGFALFDFPYERALLAIGLAVYAGVLLKWPNVWLVAVPVALPLLDLAPWSGRFFLDEFDLLMLVTAAALFLRRQPPRAALPAAWPLPAMWLAALAISGLLGLGVPPPVDANAFSSYWSPYNSLRVAKGFLWGGLIFLWLRQGQLDPETLGRRLALGMGLGLLGVGLVGLWERWLFAGFADANHTYRIVSTFSSMHTGGGHIEAYLAAALPFLWLGMARLRTLPLTLPVMALTVYVTIFTVARGGVLALGVVLLTLAVASLRLAWRTSQRSQAAIPIVVLTLLAAGLSVGIGGGYFQQRLAQTGQDWQTRVDHWGQAIAMMDGTPMAQLFGMGLGSFPRVYLERGPADKQPATFGFVTEKDNTFLRLGTGDTLYYAQRVAVRAGENYHLELDARSRQAGARIEAPVCEKQLLNSRRCVWIALDVPGDGQWHRLTHDFSSAEVGIEEGLRRPPVELFLYYPGKSGLIDVDNVRLLTANGADLIGNGGYTWGGDYWFFKTHSHLPWHIKNVWVHVLFEQGWLGLLLFVGLVGFALSRLSRAAWRGQRLAWAWLASLLGLLTVGLFDSLLDTPRLATLLVALSLLGVGYEWNASGPAPRRRRRRGRAPVAPAGKTTT